MITSTAKYSENYRFASKEPERIELLPVFETATSAVNYSCVSRNWQGKMAAKQGAHTSVIQIVIHLWKSRVLRRQFLALSDHGAMETFLRITRSGQTQLMIYPTSLWEN